MFDIKDEVNDILNLLDNIKDIEKYELMRKSRYRSQEGNNLEHVI